VRITALEAGRANEATQAEYDCPLEIAFCTILPVGNHTFSVQLPAIDREDGMQAVYEFLYDRQNGVEKRPFPAKMRVIPLPVKLGSHCMDATEGSLAEDCLLTFEESRPIEIHSDFAARLSEDEISALNAYLEKWAG